MRGWEVATNIEPQAGVLDQFADQPAEKPNPDHGLRYHSREFMDREWKYLWPKVWLLAGVVSDVQETGDYIKFDVGPESFVIVRDDQGALRAFYNVRSEGHTSELQSLMRISYAVFCL